MNSLEDLLVDELQVLLGSELQLIEALPGMTEAASLPELQAALLERIEATEREVDRLLAVLGDIHADAQPRTCPLTRGLVGEDCSWRRTDATERLRDAGVALAAHRISQSQAAGYGSAQALAQALGHAGVARSLALAAHSCSETERQFGQAAAAILAAQGPGDEHEFALTDASEAWVA